MKMAAIPVWLDDATAALVEETVSLLIKRHADILLAVILFGSIARHEERLPDDACPSDVDLLAIFDTTDRLVKLYREDIFATIIDACALHLDAPREVNVLLSDRTMQAGTPCSLTTWLATVDCSILVVPFPLHSLRDSLFKEFLKTKASDADNHTKGWQGL